MFSFEDLKSWRKNINTHKFNISKDDIKRINILFNGLERNMEARDCLRLAKGLNPFSQSLLPKPIWDFLNNYGAPNEILRN